MAINEMDQKVCNREEVSLVIKKMGRMLFNHMYLYMDEDVIEDPDLRYVVRTLISELMIDVFSLVKMLGLIKERG